MEASCGFNLNYFVVGFLIGMLLAKITIVAMARPKKNRKGGKKIDG